MKIFYRRFTAFALIYTLLVISQATLSDEIEEDKEKEFVINLREHLKLGNDMIIERFGVIDYLTKEESEFKSFDYTADIEIKEIKGKKK